MPREHLSFGPHLAVVRDPSEGTSGGMGPTPNPDPCDAKDCDGRPESVGTLETQGL
jgi:hypothetical protein